MLSWLWPSSRIEWTPLDQGSSLDNAVSGILLLGKLYHEEGGVTDIRIEYQKAAPDYTNLLILDEQKFGYEHFPGVPCCSLYNQAYVDQWRRFTSLCSGATVETGEEEARRLGEYARSFRWLRQAHQALGFNPA